MTDTRKRNVITFRMPDAQRDWLAAKAESLNVSQSAILLDILTAFMDGRLVKAAGKTVRKDV